MGESHSFDTAYRSVVRGQLEPVYYLTGEEEVLKEELVSLILAHAADPASRDFNVDVRYAGDLDGESVHALVETPPMLAERRVVVIKNLEQWRKNAKVWRVLDQYLASPSPTTVLVLTHGAGERPRKSLAGRAAHVQVAPLRPDRLTKWVAVRAKRAGVALEPEAAHHLVQAVGDDLAHLATEIDKLAAALPNDAAVTAPQIAPLVGVRRGETMHDWVRAAVVERDVPKALRTLDAVLAGGGVTGVRLLMALGTALIGVRLARALADAGARRGQIERRLFNHMRAARPYGLGSWKAEARAWTEAVGRWPTAALDRAIRAALLADRALKATTVRDEGATLRDMLYDFHSRREAA